MATKCVAGAGYRATCVDLNDYVKAGYAVGEGTIFDINSPSGFVPLSKQRMVGDDCNLQWIALLSLFV